MRSVLTAAVLFSLTLAAASCGGEKEQEKAERTVFAMDTVMMLTAYGENAQTALDAAETEIMDLDRELDRGTEGSDIYNVNKMRSAQVSDETAELVREALSVCSSTGGIFDISIAPVMDAWGFYTKTFRVPEADELEAELAKVDYGNISVNGNVITIEGESALDLGGAAKGYLSGRIMEIFEENGVKSGIVSLGGNVETLDKKPDGSLWKVGIENPDGEGYVGVVSVSGKAVVTSGGYERYFEQEGVTYHHIIDPRTGYPAESGVKSVTIVSDDGMLADGLSTALFVMGAEDGAEYWRENDGFDVIFITDSGEVLITEGLEGSFESENGYSVIKR